MEIQIKRLEIEQNPLNEVKSEKIFQKRKYSNDKGEFIYNNDGIFSPTIFGSLEECKCRKTKWPQTKCKHCGHRIVSRANMPTFYIPSSIRLPRIDIDYNKLGNKAEQEIIKNIMNFSRFLIEDGYEFINPETNDSSIEYIVPLNLNILDLSKLEEKKDKLHFGFDALVKAYEMGILSKELDYDWYYENTIDKIPIPHPVYRPMIRSGNKFILGAANEAYSDIIQAQNKINSFEKYLDEEDIIGKMLQHKKLAAAYEKACDTIFDLITKGKKSVLKQEMLSQPITGAIRGVLVNNAELDEDVILIGKEFVSTLWPHLYRDYGMDIDKINEEIEKRGYKVAVNRPPTIGQKSFMGMIPKVSDKDDSRFVLQTNSIIYDGMAADTDGDQLLIVSLYSDKSNKEIEKLLPSNNYIGANDGKVRNKIPEDLLYAMYQAYEYHPEHKKEIKNLINAEDDTNYEQDVLSLEKLPRSEYIKLYHMLEKFMWSDVSMPTVGDFASFFESQDDESKDHSKISDIGEFTGNMGKIEKLLRKDTIKYSDEDSNEHMQKVISANKTEISMSGWFYKKLMSSSDDIRLIEDDCGAEAVKFNLDDIDLSTYEFKIQFMWVEELQQYATYSYEDFVDKINRDLPDATEIHVRTLLNCNNAKDRCLCKKCVGVFKLNHDKEIQPNDFGIFATLMVTEHATQGSLDSMNKGKSTNVNYALDRKPDRLLTWEEAKDFINDTCDMIGSIGVHSRFYQCAMMSRFYKNALLGKYNAFPLNNSIRHQDDKLGLFIYASNKDNFINMIQSGKFNANSIKTQIMFDLYENKE